MGSGGGSGGVCWGSEGIWEVSGGSGKDLGGIWRVWGGSIGIWCDLERSGRDLEGIERDLVDLGVLGDLVRIWEDLGWDLGGEGEVFGV